MSIQLLRSQKNELLQRIEIAKLNPRDFFWEETSSLFAKDESGAGLAVPKLLYSDTGFFYVFDLKGDNHYAIYSPGADIAIDQRYPGGWDYQLEYFDTWLSYINRETGESDLWTNLVTEAGSLGNPLVELSDSSITEVEKEIVSKKLDLIAERVDSIAAKSDSIGTRIDFLKNELHQQSRKAWFFLLVGVLATVGTGISLAPQQGEALVAYLREIISSIGALLSSNT
ncbi:hypothetical protein KAR02_07330 [Candidatus Bipolaricaulota bacterium]|nr:hypothetical protein [Candidatus Bipolaricaulota bacterium]